VGATARLELRGLRGAYRAEVLESSADGGALEVRMILRTGEEEPSSEEEAAEELLIFGPQEARDTLAARVEELFETAVQDAAADAANPWSGLDGGQADSWNQDASWNAQQGGQTWDDSNANSWGQDAAGSRNAQQSSQSWGNDNANSWGQGQSQAQHGGKQDWNSGAADRGGGGSKRDQWGGGGGGGGGQGWGEQSAPKQDAWGSFKPTTASGGGRSHGGSASQWPKPSWQEDWQAKEERPPEKKWDQWETQESKKVAPQWDQQESKKPAASPWGNWQGLSQAQDGQRHQRGHGESAYVASTKPVGSWW